MALARRTVETILRIAKCKDKHKKNIRYDADWLLECLRVYYWVNWGYEPLFWFQQLWIGFKYI